MNVNQKINYYTSSEELDSDDERIREKLRRKRLLRKQNNKTNDNSESNYLQNMQIIKQNNEIDVTSKTKNNNKIYPVTYHNDGINKTKTYHSTLEEPGVKGRATFTLHQTNHSEGYHFESRTQTAGTSQPFIEENGEERYQGVEYEEALPEITMGALYIEEIEDDDDISVGDENNNFIEDPDTIDLTMVDTNLEAMSMKKINGHIQWIDLEEESSQRYSTAVRRKPSEIKILNIKGGNGEEHAGKACDPVDGMLAEMPGGVNHATTDAAGRPSILRALLERPSRSNSHSRIRTEEDSSLKEKNLLEEINIRGEVRNILNNATWRKTLKETIKHNLVKENKLNKESDKLNEIKKDNIEKYTLEIKDRESNKFKPESNTIDSKNNKMQPESNIINSSKDNLKIKTKLNQNDKHKEETIQINNNTHQNRWKNIMTLIHNPVLQNINQTCGGGCRLRRQISESDISSGETTSIHSGTDSLYERISPDNSPARQAEDIIISQESITDSLNYTLNRNNSPEKATETNKNSNTQNNNNYLRADPEDEQDQPEEKRWRYIIEESNTLPERRSPRDKFDSLTSTQTDDPEGYEQLEETCKKKKEINKADEKKDKIKLNKKLIPYYLKIKSKLKSYRIYLLKRHVKILRRIIKNKNRRLAYLTRMNEEQDGEASPRTREHMRSSHNEPVQEDNQSQHTAISGVSTRKRQQPMSRELSITVGDNRKTCDARVILTYEGRYKANTEMESEESRLLRLYREKVKEYEEEEARRASRIEHLKSLISSIPDVVKIPEDKDHRIEEEIDEANEIYNALNESKTIYRIMEEVRDRKGTEVAKFGATVNIKTDPTRMQADKQGIMAILIIKNREIRVETRLLGDINLDALGNLQIKMSGIEPIELNQKIDKRRGTKTTVTRTETRSDATNVPKVRGRTPVTTQPEETAVPCPDTIEQEITIQAEGDGEEDITRTSTPEMSTPEATAHSYREKERSRNERAA